MEYGTFDKLDDPVEADETYIGGKTKEEHGRFSNKSAIVGVVERKSTLAKLEPLPLNKHMPVLHCHSCEPALREGATLHTDESKSTVAQIERLFMSL